MKNYLIVAVIIILIIVGVVWYKSQSPVVAPSDEEIATTTEPLLPTDDASMLPSDGDIEGADDTDTATGTPAE